MTKKLDEEVEFARRIHDEIRHELRESEDILLSVPNRQIVHKLGSPLNASANVPELRGEYDLAKLIESNEVCQDDSARELFVFGGQWSQGGDHHLLFRILKAGLVPNQWPESATPDRPRRLSESLALAKERGYSVPDKYLEETPVSRPQREAWLAGSEIARGHFAPFLELQDEWRENLYQHTGEFVVPDPLKDWKSPYVLDQLWIVRAGGDGVRLLALEIDGEAHLGKSKSAQTERDILLAGAGYEVYRAAGWWCRVDPFKVICEFLSASGLAVEAKDSFPGYWFKAMNDYRCGLCGEPMVRFDSDWIQEIRGSDGRLRVGHRSCIAREG